MYETAFVKIHKRFFFLILELKKNTFMFDNLLQMKYGKKIRFHIDFHNGV